MHLANVMHENDCHTAQEVIARARAVAEKRKRWATPIVRSIAPRREAEPTLPPGPPPLSSVCFPAHALADATITIKAIQKAVAREWPIKIDVIFSSSRLKAAVEPRHLAIVLCRCLTERSLPEIGYRFGGRDHTSVLYIVRKYRWLIDSLQAEMSPVATLDEWVVRAIELFRAHKK